MTWRWTILMIKSVPGTFLALALVQCLLIGLFTFHRQASQGVAQLLVRDGLFPSVTLMFENVDREQYQPLLNQLKQRPGILSIVKVNDQALRTSLQQQLLAADLNPATSLFNRPFHLFRLYFKSANSEQGNEAYRQQLVSWGQQTALPLQIGPLIPVERQQITQKVLLWLLDANFALAALFLLVANLLLFYRPYRLLRYQRGIIASFQRSVPSLSSLALLQLGGVLLWMAILLLLEPSQGLMTLIGGCMGLLPLGLFWGWQQVRA